MIRELESPFGNVCPLLKLSEHYATDYTAVLQMADYQIHNRLPLGTTIDEVKGRLGVHGDYGLIRDGIDTIVHWMLEQHYEAQALEADNRLSFSKNLGKWIVV